nr:hypothetical protein GCM10025730_17140 [Promicromonospora thailandica]
MDPNVAEQLGFTVHDVVQDLRRDVATATLPLPIDGADEAEASRERLLAQLDEHLLPRLAELSSPAVVVLAGSTGAGKSTLFNSLLREEVSEAGVLRPTTREPVVGVHPRDVDTLTPGPVTELARLVKHEGVQRGTALMDAPDLDSFLSENRSTAHQLLEAADLWLFVTTAARYGDALPWQALDRARERGASVAMVLNRVPRENLTTIRADLNTRLKERGMKDVPLFIVPDVGPHEGLLDHRLVEPIQRWLGLMAGPERSRTIILRTLKGALGALPDWVMGLVSAVEQQGTAAFDLRNAVQAVVPDAQLAARTAVLSGAAGEGTVAARFAELASTRNIARVTVREGVTRTTKRAGKAGRPRSSSSARRSRRPRPAPSWRPACAPRRACGRSCRVRVPRPPGSCSWTPTPSGPPSGSPAGRRPRGSGAGSATSSWASWTSRPRKAPTSTRRTAQRAHARRSATAGWPPCCSARRWATRTARGWSTGSSARSPGTRSSRFATTWRTKWR